MPSLSCWRWEGVQGGTHKPHTRGLSPELVSHQCLPLLSFQPRSDSVIPNQGYRGKTGRDLLRLVLTAQKTLTFPHSSP